MKMSRCLVLSLGLAAGAATSVRAQHATDLEKAFRPVEFKSMTGSILKLPTAVQVDPTHRISGIGDLKILGPMNEPIGDFLTWADKLRMHAQSPAGIRLSDGSILRLDGHDLMVSPSSGILKRNGITYGIASGKGVAGPALRFKF